MLSVIKHSVEDKNSREEGFERDDGERALGLFSPPTVLIRAACRIGLEFQTARIELHLVGRADGIDCVYVNSKEKLTKCVAPVNGTGVPFPDAVFCPMGHTVTHDRQRGKEGHLGSWFSS